MNILTEETPTLSHLVAEAVQLGGGDLCVTGHDWKDVGGRACALCRPEYTHVRSQSVYQCARCGEYDYGDDPQGPGWQDCAENCDQFQGTVA